MFNILFFVILTATRSVASDDTLNTTQANGTSAGVCVLPPYPNNGFYVTGSGGTPGDTTNDYVLNVTCNPRYKLIGEKVVTCLQGWISGDMPECLPYCEPDTKTSVVTCGADAPRCVLDSSNGIGEKTSIPKFHECGDLGVITSEVIAGGHKAKFDELPWHAGIYKKTTTPYMQICGGSLISPKVVISAAHCFWTDLEKLQPATNFAVAVGKLYRPWNNERDTYAQKSDVYAIKIPDRFRGSATNFQDDIAVVIVTNIFEYNNRVKPVCLSFDHQLDDKQLQDGNFGTVGGWGLTGEDSKPSQVLQAVRLPYVDVNKCISESPPSFMPYITCDKICAGYHNGTAVCKGDSGGGLVFGETVEYIHRYFLRGVVSTAPNNEHLCNVFTWGTFTHVTSHERFIKAALRGAAPLFQESPVSENIYSSSHFKQANLKNFVMKKPTYQWV